MNIAVVMAIWQRPEVTGLALEHLAQQRERLRDVLTLEPYVVGSEGTVSEALAKRVGAQYAEHENLPLGLKYQRGFDEARKSDPDGVVLLGSDNFVTDNIWTAWAEELDAGTEYAGVIDAYQYSTRRKTLYHWTGYTPWGGRYKQTMGSARLYARSLLDRMDWHLWDLPKSQGGPDKVAANMVEAWGADSRRYRLAELDAAQVGVKTGQDVTDYETFLERNHWDIETVPVGLLDTWFGDIGRRIRKL